MKKNETGEVNKKVKSLGAHYKDAEKSVISIVKYLDETLETLDAKKSQLRKKVLRPNGATKDDLLGKTLAQRKTTSLETLDVKNKSFELSSLKMKHQEYHSELALKKSSGLRAIRIEATN